MKVKRRIRKLTEEQKRKIEINLPGLFKESHFFSYLDFEQLSLEKLEKRLIEQEKKWIEYKREHGGIEDEEFELWEKIEQWEKEKNEILETKIRNEILEEKMGLEIIKIKEKIKNGELLKVRNLIDWNCDVWNYVYKEALYEFDRGEYTDEERVLLILELEDKERRKFEQLKRKFVLSQETEKGPKREIIPEAVRIAVWRRDGGKCSKCESRKNLEYDHIIPVSKGGSNTVRNIELLCEKCNRKKKDKIE